MNLLLKISPATVMGPDRKRPSLEAPDNGRAWWYRVSGVVMGSEEKASTFQNDDGSPTAPSVALRGSFEAIRFDNGETFQSSVCFLPQGVAEIVRQMLADKRGRTGKPNDGLTILFDIGAIPSKREPLKTEKYEYVVRLPIEDHQQLSETRRLMLSAPLPPGVTKALPALPEASPEQQAMLTGQTGAGDIPDEDETPATDPVPVTTADPAPTTYGATPGA